MSASSGLALDPLTGGDAASAASGSHVVLEAADGSLLHCVRVAGAGCVALRAGKVLQFQLSRALPAAAVVRYPDPLGARSASELEQVVERARCLVGLPEAEVASRLARAGADASLLSGGTSELGELLASFCATGISRHWAVTDAYRAFRAHPPRVEGGRGLGVSSSSPAAGSSTPAASVAAPVISSDRCDEGWSPSSTSAMSSPAPAPTPAAGTASAGTREQLAASLQEKAFSTAVHVGLRGSAARAAGAAAAIGVEGYTLYREITDHADKLGCRNISNDQFQERVCESAVSSSGRAIGGLAGAAAGQAAIPVPVLGAVVGGVIGAACGGFHASSVANGMMRLSGGKAKGGDDLVRCVEHKRPSAAADDNASGALAADGAPAPWPSAAPAAAARRTTELSDDEGLL